MDRVKVIKELETIMIDDNKYIICLASLDGNSTTLLKNDSKSFTAFLYNKQFEFDYDENNNKGLEEYTWSTVEQVIK